MYPKPVTWPHLVSERQFTPEILDLVFDTTTEMIAMLKKVGGRLNKWPTKYIVDGYFVTLMNQPSTRTGLSFQAAIHNLGGRSTYVANAAETTSLAKGESIEDMYRMLRQNHPAAVIVRTLNESEPVIAAQLFSDYPGTNPDISEYTRYINAGSGTRAHPTQAVLDMFTIREVFGTLSGLTAVVAGDLGHARAVNSLFGLIERACPDINLLIAAPVIGGMLYDPPDFVLKMLDAGQVSYEVVPIEHHDDIVRLCHKDRLFYLTRPQTEYYGGRNLPADFGARMTELIQLTPQMLDTGMRAFHPLPHRDEVLPGVMNHKNAMFEQQASRGVPVRMALIYLMLRCPELLVGGDLIY